MLDSIQFTNWMKTNISWWHTDHTQVHTCTLLQRYVTELRVRSIATSALFSTVSNCECDLWLQVRYRMCLWMKWFSPWNMDRVHDLLRQLSYWDKMLLLEMLCPKGASGSYVSPAGNVVSFVTLHWYPPFCFYLICPLWLNILLVTSSGTQSRSLTS